MRDVRGNEESGIRGMSGDKVWELMENDGRRSNVSEGK